MKPTHGLQEKPMDKTLKYNSRQPLVHRDCHQLPKPNMGLPHVLSLRKQIAQSQAVLKTTIKHLVDFKTKQAETNHIVMVLKEKRTLNSHLVNNR